MRALYTEQPMQFDRALVVLTRYFDQHRIRYAITGGFALHAYGSSRLTHDLDFLVDRERQAEIISYMEGSGYDTLHRSEGYSNHLHTDAALGRVDFIYVSGPTAERVFGGATRQLTIGEVSLPVPRPEHLAAMKILAIKNDPQRKFREMADLEFLLSLPGIDRDEVRDYFARHDLLKLFDELTKGK